MPKKIIVKVTWSTQKPLPMSALAEDTVTDMTGNANFTTPVVPLADMTDAAALVVSTYANRMNGDLAKTAFEDAVTDLDRLMHLQADYVSNLSGGIKAKIESSGFIATSNVQHPAVRCATPGASKTEALGGGRVKSSVAKVAGAEEYTHIFYSDAASVIEVTQFQVTMSSATGGSFNIVTGGLREEATGLAPQTKTNVTVIAHNAAGNSNASPIVSTGVL